MNATTDWTINEIEGLPAAFIACWDDAARKAMGVEC